MRLREYRREIARYGELLIKAVPAARHGVGKLSHHEIEMVAPASFPFGFCVQKKSRLSSGN